MDWSDVKIFLAVARAGSLTAAAQALGLSQPTTGRRLAAFEQATGQRLFQRGKEGFRLTDEGLAILGFAQRMEEDALGIERQLAGRGSELEGLLRISSSDWFGTYVLSPIIADFLERNTGMRVELLTDPRIFDLSRREADLVFRISTPDEPEVVRRKVMHMTYALYGQVGSMPPRAYQESDVKIVGLNQSFEDMPDAVWLRQTYPKARLVYGSNNREAQARMCALGTGFAVLPTLLGDAFPGLVRHHTDLAPPGRDVWCAYHRDFRSLARLRAFVDLACGQLAAMA